MRSVREIEIPDSFDYVGNVYRPPNEADSILIQATVGCSHGACTFCSGHAEKTFALKNSATLERDLAFAARYCKRQDRIFVMDGNALVMPFDRWVRLLEIVRSDLPWVRGVGCFAMGKDIAGKSDAELEHLRALGLDRLYVGIESGSAAALRRINKGIGPQELLDHCLRAKRFGMTLYITVLLGIVNEAESAEHAKATGALLTALNPDVVTAMTLIPQPGTAMYDDVREGRLRPPEPEGILQELRELYLHTDLRGGLFDYGHSSGYFSFTARLPEERDAGLLAIDSAMRGGCALKDEARRRL